MELQFCRRWTKFGGVSRASGVLSRLCKTEDEEYWCDIYFLSHLFQFSIMIVILLFSNTQAEERARTYIYSSSTHTHTRTFSLEYALFTRTNALFTRTNAAIAWPAIRHRRREFTVCLQPGCTMMTVDAACSPKAWHWMTFVAAAATTALLPSHFQ